MTCAEFKELAAAYALGALTPEERAACDAHLESAATAEHGGCFEALAEATETANALALALPPVKPSADLWKAIEAETVGASSSARGGERRARGSIVPWLLAAAMLLVILFLGFSRHELQNQLARLDDEKQQCARELQAVRDENKLRDQAVAMLEAPTGRAVAMAPTPDAPPSLRATAIYDVKDKRGMLLVAGLDKPADKDFELWVIKGDEKRPAGLLRSAPGQSLVTAIDPKQLADGEVLAVTLEPAGGGDTPRGKAVLVATLPKT